MRVLEFRVWTGTEMVYDVMVGKFGAFYVNPANNGMDENDAASLTHLNTKYPDTCPVMQYLCKNDAAGNKTFTGDIIIIRGRIGVVAYDPHTCAFIVENPLSNEDWDCMDILDDAIVIGNIYENPELLQE